MTTGTMLRLAWRESRTARRRLALYMSSIAFGVAALVAIDSFALNVTRSIREQSRTLMGGDMELQAQAAFPAVVDTLIDSLSLHGVKNARLTNFVSMALAEKSGGTRLVQVRAVSPGYPFYGGIDTDPATAWQRVHEDALVFVDPSLLIAIDAKVGDQLRLGMQVFTIAGTLKNAPGDAGISSVIGPRVYFSDRWLERTQLLSFGSRAERSIILQLPPRLASEAEAATIKRDLRRRIDPKQALREEAREKARGGARTNAQTDTRADAQADTQAETQAGAETDTPTGAVPQTRVRIRTVAESEADFTDAVLQLADFLSIIGLIALLLGGIGVASGINAFVNSKIDTVAILRCLGATSKQVLAIYVVQAAVMGLVGATVGVLLGLTVQFLLPDIIGGFLPFDVHITLEIKPLLMGLATGVWVALVFALRPLLALRRISPLQAIRRNADQAALPKEWKDPARLAVDLLLVASIGAIVVERIGSVTDGIGVMIGMAIAIGVLWASATALISIARRAVRPSWPFPIRQGVANLYRPANQTRAVTLVLGFGAFLLSTVYLVHSNVLGRVNAGLEGASGNLLFFDVQGDQATSIDSILNSHSYRVVQETPIVTMRLESVARQGSDIRLADTTLARAARLMRREFRSTYRDSLTVSETLISGKRFPSASELQLERTKNPNAPFLLSLEESVARDLAVGLGDTLTWNVQGVSIRTVVSNTRSVNWGRFSTNFFAVFEPAALSNAPQQHVIIADIPTAEGLAGIQRDVVRRFPNVSSLDLTVIRETIATIVSRVSMAIRFLGLFSLGMGIPVLFSAVSATRGARLRECVLLRTLGASRVQILQVLTSEYAVLGGLGALTGMCLSFGGAWALTHFVFRTSFNPALQPLFTIAVVMLALTVIIGLVTSRDVYQETPMSAIRDTA